MSIPYSVSDMLTRIRNACQRDKKTVDIPVSKIKLGIVKVLKNEGYIEDYKLEPGTKQGIIKITLKDKRVITHIETVSKPSRRIYRGYKYIPQVLDGLGIAILSTPNGILSDREAKKQKVGGEILAYIW